MVVPDRGAEIQARTVKPSIDLAQLIKLIAKAVPVSIASQQNESQDPQERSAFLFDTQKQRLRVCTSAVLRRLFRQSEFRQAFDSTKGNGFVQDLSSSAFGIDSRIGGCLAEGNDQQLTKAVDALMAAINQGIDAALPTGVSLSALLLNQPEQQLQQLAKQVRVPFKYQTNTANLIPIAFKSNQALTQQDKTVAKVISAIERIDAADYFDQMCHAVSDYLLYQRDCDEEDIEAATDSLAAEQSRVDSQITRFLNFLDNEALSRVRLTIACQIMEAIADSAQTINQSEHQLLVQYIRRVIRLTEACKTTGYSVDLTAHYGAVAEFELLDYLSQATFYSCLPVWAEWKTQIFEKKVSNQAATSYGVVREVSYRFRVNGQKPETGKPALEGRLDDIQEDLEDWEAQSKAQPRRFCRRLAELIFLSVIIPQRDSQTEEDFSEVVPQLLSRLKSGGQEAIQDVLHDLRARAPVMQAIATALIQVLRTKSQRVVSQVQRRSSQQFICVKRSLIEWSRLEGAEAGVRDLLVGAPQQSREQVEWFKHIEISDTPTVPDLLFSVSVTTEVSEHSLVVQGEAASLQAQRLFPPHILQVCWVPYCTQKEADQWTYKIAESVRAAKDWVLPASIHVEYDLKTLEKQNGNKQADQNKQFHAAAISAFAVLVYCCLWQITQRLKHLSDNPPEFTTLMLRLQETGRSTESGNGGSYVYAAAQAIEAMLGQDLKIRMQGIVLDNLTQPRQSAQWVKRGVFDALQSAFPIAISTPKLPAVPKIGFISYVTRPCDDHPALSNDEKGHLLLTQSYTATAIEEPFVGYRLQLERRQADIVETPEQIKKQRLVQEEISHLKAQGCQHIVLMSHSYGSRHFNRAADYNSFLTPQEFLREISTTFSDLTIYTLLRDVFPATRVHRRTPTEAAFEILRAGDHSAFLQTVETVRVRDVIPVYTFATLHVVGDSTQQEKRPQSGFCVYFLVSDHRVDNFNWTERPRQHLVDADQQSAIHPCLISLLRGLHFMEAERGVKQGQLMPVLDPFSWISPATIEAAGEVEIMHTRRKGKVQLSYPAVLCHVARVLHRRK
jgi:hypothetical protein